MTARRRYKPMPPLTRTAERALRKCIREKWEPALVEYKEGYVPHWLVSPGSCALCNEYFGCGCRSCPIRQRTGEAGCRNSPFDRVHKLYAIVSCNEYLIRAAIAAEVRFLYDTLRLGLKARERAKEKK